MIRILTTAAMLLSFVASGGGQTHRAKTDSFRSLLMATARQPIQAMSSTDDQQKALWNCLAATERIRRITETMAHTGKRWSRSRLNYDQNDLTSLSEDSNQVEREIDILIAAHKSLRSALSDAQRQRVESESRKLDDLDQKLNSQIHRLGKDIKAAKPGPNAPDISWDINGIKSSTDKWGSTIRKVAKQLQIPIYEGGRK